MNIPSFDSRPRALSVSELNHQVRHLLEASLGQAWVEGELSSFARPSSGHWYFTLKDRKCQVRCAMFKGANQRVKVAPKEGDLVRIRGKVSLYENRGDYQILVEHMEPAGLGDLQAAFEALKAKLQAEGLFDQVRKKPVPVLPRHIGVVTSPTGAAIHDILTVLARRFPAIPVTLYPTAVQGASATADIVRAIELAGRHNRADVLIIGRGGGSLEDLWCFNEETVARAIAHCPIATVSAVGHEVDFSIADFVADLRAPTPSAAAEKLSPDQRDWLARLRENEQRLAQAFKRVLQRQQTGLDHLAARLRDPRQSLQDRAQRLDELETRLADITRRRLTEAGKRLINSESRLALQSPARQIGRHQERLEQHQQRLHREMTLQLSRLQQRLGHLGQSLNVVSPLATLDRGYAIVQTQDGRIVRETSELTAGQVINARVARGRLEATVTSTTDLPPDTP